MTTKTDKNGPINAAVSGKSDYQAQVTGTVNSLTKCLSPEELRFQDTEEEWNQQPSPTFPRGAKGSFSHQKADISKYIL